MTSPAVQTRRFGSAGSYSLMLMAIIVASAVLIAPHVDREWSWIHGDAAQYVMHAQNLIEGRPFEDTGYIYNPAYPELAPAAYPPGYPVVLAPVVAAFGAELVPIRVLSLTFFIGSLVLLGLLLRRHLSPALALAGVAIFGLNPIWSQFATSASSDSAFLIVFLGGLLLIDASRDEQSVVRAVLIGLLIYAAFATRTVGALLAPALLIGRFDRAKPATRSTLVSLGVFIVLAGLQSLLTSGSSSYFDQYRPTVAVLMTNMIGYGQDFSALWETGAEWIPLLELLRKVFTVAAIVLIGVGFVARLRVRVGVFEVFAVLYTVLIISWPAYQGLRFLLPLVPLFVLYLLAGLADVVDRVPRRLHTPALASFIALPLLAFAVNHAVSGAIPVEYAVEAPESTELFEFLRSTHEEAVIVFVKPRIVTLQTGRRAVANHQPAADGDLSTYFDGLGVTHVILGPAELDRRSYLEGFIGRNPDSFAPAFSNEWFAVFEYSN